MSTSWKQSLSSVFFFWAAHQDHFHCAVHSAGTPTQYRFDERDSRTAWPCLVYRARGLWPTASLHASQWVWRQGQLSHLTHAPSLLSFAFDLSWTLGWQFSMPRLWQISYRSGWHASFEELQGRDLHLQCRSLTVSSLARSLVKSLFTQAPRLGLRLCESAFTGF